MADRLLRQADCSSQLPEKKTIQNRIGGAMSFLNAAKQGNTLNQKSAGLDFPMHPQRLSNGTRLLPVEPGQRDMRPESSPLLCEPGKYQSMTKRPLQSGQLIHRLNPGPEIFRAIRVTETTNPGHGEVKRFHRQIPGSIANIRKPMRSEERRVGKECRSRWSPYH